MIELMGVSKSFEKKRVIDNLSYTFEEKGLYALVGNSGSGKTTLLRLIAELERPDKGTVHTPKEIAFSFQEYRLFENLTVYENIEFICYPKPTNETRKEIEKMLSHLGLSDAKNLHPSELSGGMKQRVSLIRAFLASSKVLLLDEPTKELDFELSQTVVEIIQDIALKKLVIVTVHNIEEAQKLNAQIIQL